MNIYVTHIYMYAPPMSGYALQTHYPHTVE